MLILIALANVAVRIYGCFIPLWFDEVFSLDQTRVIQYPVDVLLKLHTDNNHYLIALWLWMIGPNAPYFVYRIPSLIAGLAFPALLYAAVYPRYGRRTGMIAAFLVLVSRHDTALACEARGYSMALAFAAAAWLSLDRYIQRRNPVLGFAFALCCIAGFLAHLTFLYAYAGFGLWSLAALRDRDYRKYVRSLLLLHAPVVAFLGILYRVDLQYLQYWGGPHISLFVLLKEFVFLTFNAPHGTTIIVGFAAIALVVTGWILTYQRGGGDWLLFAGVFAAAIWGICYRIQVHTAPRYFLLTGPFLLFLIAVALNRFLDSKPMRIPVFILLIAMGIYGVTADAIKFWPGLAEYPDAVRYMAQNSGSSDKSVSCGIDYRPDFFLLQFYCQRIDRPFVPANNDPGGAIPQWWVIPKAANHPQEITRKNREYVLERIYAGQGQGWSWDLYQISPSNDGT